MSMIVESRNEVSDNDCTLGVDSLSHSHRPSTSLSSSTASNSKFVVSPSADSVNSQSSPSSSQQFIATSLPIFRNQVAGHYPLLWHDGTICKPLIAHEYDFYARLEEEVPALLPFVPKFYGVLDLQRIHHNSSDSTDSPLVLNSPSSPYDLDSPKLESTSALSSSPTSPTLSITSAAVLDDSVSHSPDDSKSHSKWGFKCQVRKQEILNQSSLPEYLVLEDLTYAYEQPCILDLKVGTRQHGDNESAAKIASKIRRCASTTSAGLALRLCGMQLYRPQSQSFIHRDKYFGRHLDGDGLYSTLRSFFHNGEIWLIDIMDSFFHRLITLRTVIQLEHRHRFYSSSMLLVYEGDPSCHGLGRHESASERALRFALQQKIRERKYDDLLQNSSFRYTFPHPHPNFLVPSTSSLPLNTIAESPSPSVSVSSLSVSGSTVGADSPSSLPSVDSAGPDVGPRVPAVSPSSTSSISSSSSITATKVYARKRKTTQAQARERARERGCIDLRLIDFARAAKLGTATDFDHGFLLGIDNLIHFLYNFLSEAHVNGEAIGSESLPVSAGSAAPVSS